MVRVCSISTPVSVNPGNTANVLTMRGGLPTTRMSRVRGAQLRFLLPRCCGPRSSLQAAPTRRPRSTHRCRSEAGWRIPDQHDGPRHRGMLSRVELHSRTDQNTFSNGEGSTVKKDAVIIDEDVPAETDVGAVIVRRRWEAPRFLHRLRSRNPGAERCAVLVRHPTPHYTEPRVARRVVAHSATPCRHRGKVPLPAFYFFRSSLTSGRSAPNSHQRVRPDPAFVQMLQQIRWIVIGPIGAGSFEFFPAITAR
jgi:hypothetical protein